MPSAASNIENPWLRMFLTDPWEETVLGQLIIRRQENGFELRHQNDFLATSLKSISLSEVRKLANFTADGKFRPLKSAGDLAAGWVLLVKSSDELETALQIFYPNVLADIYSTRKGLPPVTSYRDFTARQTGMYRITTFLNDGGVGRIMDSLCHSICIKFRLWPISGSAPTAGNRQWTEPVCLEPCAIFLEAARKAVRASQEKSARAEQADSAPE